MRGCEDFKVGWNMVMVPGSGDGMTFRENDFEMGFRV